MPTDINLNIKRGAIPNLIVLLGTEKTTLEKNDCQDETSGQKND